MRNWAPIKTAGLIVVFVAAGTFARAQPLDQLQLPARPAGSPTGSEFYATLLAAPLAQREALIYGEYRRGNVPDFMRTLKPVVMTAVISGTTRTGTIYVSPDYMAVGSDADFFRTPMSATLAQWVADAATCTLTTRKMTNSVYTAATVKLAPQTLNPNDFDIDSLETIYQHNTRIEQSRAGQPLGALVGGIKKDVVLSQRLVTQPAQVAIYGWHQLNGQAIQPLSLIHEASYEDYSHGTRLVNLRMLLDGAETNVLDVLNDPVLHPILSDEGQFTVRRYPNTPPPPIAQELPFTDAFPSTGRQLPFWSDRFQAHTVVAYSPISPGGDGFALRVRDTSGGIDAARLGSGTDRDYFVESYIHCNYRPELAANGTERVGIFLRDNGNGLFTGSSGAGVPGNCYGMTWDSSDGRVRCFRTVAGVLTDLLPVPVLLPSSAWRHMRVEAVGTSLRFVMDGEELLRATDASHAQGQMGIGYHDVYTTNANILGTFADNFHADRLDALPGEPESWSLY